MSGFYNLNYGKPSIKSTAFSSIFLYRITLFSFIYRQFIGILTAASELVIANVPPLVSLIAGHKSPSLIY